MFWWWGTGCVAKRCVNFVFVRSKSRRIGKMPPKKKTDEGPPPMLGRFGTSLKVGIVGLPNVGCVFNVNSHIYATDCSY